MRHTKNPGSLAAARVRNISSCAATADENFIAQSPIDLNTYRVAHLARRHRLPPTVAALVAGLAWRAPR
jgi:hypothetical protein